MESSLLSLITDVIFPTDSPLSANEKVLEIVFYESRLRISLISQTVYFI